ncbi:MAG TPA: helix-turn-helix domain-containing protein [Thermoleophilaceae bacterium]|nr:helix-turn-helix domain-containing protein [Thermoleophilaceae bacterium]
MSQRVKSNPKPAPKRRYDSSRRREQAAVTRRAILAAAQRLFERDGYPATSMAAVAREAGVAVKTVYLAFETKSGLLRAVWHLLLRGDEDAAPIGDRAWYRAVLEERDPVEKLRATAGMSVAVKTRAGALMEAIRTAAPVDPDAAELWGRIQADFLDNQRAIVESMAETGALRPELDVDSATDVLWTINHPSTYWLLVGERGWSAERFGDWLAATFREQLLA